MANPQYTKVKTEAAQSIARAKARQGEVNAKAQVLKAKAAMARAAK
jgi:hypothetical protein